MSDWTSADLEAINKAIKSGVTRVKYADRDVTYMSLADMIRVRNIIRDDLGLTGDSGGRTYRLAEHSKGLQ